MRVAWLEARDFRNYAEVAVTPGDGVTAIVGPNGQGKTNLLEAVHYLCTLESPRVSADLPLVRTGASSAFLRGEVVSEAGTALVEVEIRGSGANRVQVNRSVVRRKRDLRRHVRSVFLGPDDLSVVQGDPGERRRFLDEAVRTLWPARDTLASAYERVVRQRNRLLKDWGGAGAPPDLVAWDAELVRHGAALMSSRAAAVDAVAPLAEEEFAHLVGTDREALVVRYEPSVQPDQGETLEDAFTSRLAERRDDELIRRTSLVGPHRDDLSLRIEGLVARGFASHGEAWGAAIALRLGLARAVAAETGEPPVTLLDDPFSGLDPERRARLSASLHGRGQVLLAVPDLAHVPGGAATWAVAAGAVSTGGAVDAEA